MKYLYKYPQREFPYGDLVETNRRAARRTSSSTSCSTPGVFDDDRYFDVFVEYAKAGPEDILIRITVHNRGPEAAQTAPAARRSGSATPGRGATRRAKPAAARGARRRSWPRTPSSASYTLSCDGAPELLFTENETQRASGSGASRTPRRT